MNADPDWSLVIDLTGDRLSIYDLDAVMREAWRTQKGGRDQMAACHPHTAPSIDAALKPFRQSETVEGLGDLTFRWGSLTIHETPFVPEGTLLFIPRTDFPDWQKQMERSFKIINIGADTP